LLIFEDQGDFKMMKIYTKGGDSGETGLFGGSRVPKDDLRIRAYGTLDELNACLGLVISEESIPNEIEPLLLRLQGDLFQLGSELATPRGKSVGIALVDDPQVEVLEKEIDQMEGQLTPLKNFILPGGSRGAALLHLVRTISRRAEREIVTLNRAEPLRPVILRYINRLSDYFFVLARYTNHLSQIQDVPWKPRSTSVAPKKSE
jgi:cob(I)alamin adenosyltransferase